MDKLDKIHHVTVTVAHLEQAINWYTTSFSCELIYSDAKQALIQFENARLHLTLPSMQQAHVAYLRKDAASLGELYQQLGDIKSTSIADPSGNVVEIVLDEREN